MSTFIGLWLILCNMTREYAYAKIELLADVRCVSFEKKQNASVVLFVNDTCYEELNASWKLGSTKDIEDGETGTDE